MKQIKEDHTMLWKVDIMALITELVESNPTAWVCAAPARILQGILIGLAKRAIELDDPELNIIMIRMALYDVPKSETSKAIKQQENRIKQQQK